MQRIKDINQVIVRGDAILAKIVEVKTKSNIIIPGESASSIDYMEVVTVGNKIEDLEPGDIIMDIPKTSLDSYKIGDTHYVILYRGNIRIAVKKDNFDITKTESKTNLIA